MITSYYVYLYSLVDKEDWLSRYLCETPVSHSKRNFGPTYVRGEVQKFLIMLHKLNVRPK